MTFGQAIASARKDRGLSQKELAALVKKEDGTAISPQYLNDIEHDRRSPSSDYLIEQFASVLGLPAEYLSHLAGELPRDIKGIPVDQQRVVEAYKVFRRELRRK